MWQHFQIVPHPYELPKYQSSNISFIDHKFHLSITNGSRVIEKERGSTFEDCRIVANFLNHDFQLSMTNSSRVIENGCGSTFEECHALLSCKTINRLS